ncbi:hypothetical protein D3P96_08290 [Weissella viridescens]|uniref:Uncharacterized protein n=1 Tax=Weissella viridescens TaxID=1629 RepID=A0A3P2RDA3_WEIVI|nr:hypothetical protein [Weissella viridescens]RRG17335.1 hypothetical protein D3P96_08290 [Weissella viridescens]
MPTPQVEAVDTIRVNSFFMWQDIMNEFAKDFYVDCQLIISDIPDTPNIYLRRLKNYSHHVETYDQRWSNMAEILELVGLASDVDLLRDWYKSVVRVNRLVDEYLQQLTRMPNLDYLKIRDIRLYNFVDTVRPLCVTFVEAQPGVMKHIKQDFLKTLHRAPIELRLLDSVRTKFNHVFDEFEETKVAFYAVEQQGAFKGFDGVYANMVIQINEVKNALEHSLMDEFDVIGDDQLLTNNGMLVSIAKGIGELLLGIPKQATYSIQGLEHGAFGTDIFEIVQTINNHLKYFDAKRQDLLARISELMVA